MTNETSPLRRETFEGLYAAPKAPWDIGRPQTAFVEAGRRIQGRVIDIGCGTGDLALWLVEQGCTVTGVDFLPKPLEMARRKAAERALAVTFIPMDATAVGELPEAFDAVTDCGLFHVFDDAGRHLVIADVKNIKEAKTVGGANLEVTHHLLTGVHIGTAKEMAHVQNSDIHASNGVIHVIDKVILP